LIDDGCLQGISNENEQALPIIGSACLRFDVPIDLLDCHHWSPGWEEQ
jgi:hypothetical protein